MACWEWKTTAPQLSQSSLSATSMKKKLQIKWLDGALCPTGMVSQGQRNKSLLVLAAASSCSTPLVRKEKVRGGGRQMIIRLPKSLLGVAYDRSNHGFPWEDDNLRVQKTSLKRNPKKGNKYRASTLPRSKKKKKKNPLSRLWRCFLDREERCQNLLLEKSPTQSGYQNTAGNPRGRGLCKHCVSLVLRRTNSVTRKFSVWLQLLIYSIGIQQLSFANSSLSYCFPPSLSSSVFSCTPPQLTYVHDNSLNIVCWLSERAYLQACLQLLVLLIFLSHIVIYWIAVKSNYF